MSSVSKVAIVTGAGTGIGKRTALALLQEGYSVSLAGRRAETLEMTAAEAGQSGCRALLYLLTWLNLPPSEPSSPRRRRFLGGLTCCLTMRDWRTARTPGRITYEQWKTVVDVNLTGAFLCTQEAFRIMKSQKPRGGRNHQ